MSSVKRCPTAIFLHLGRRFLCTPSALALASTCASSSQSFANNKLLLQWQFHPQSQSQSESQRSEHFSRFGYTSVSVLRFSACVREPGHGRYITACALFFFFCSVLINARSRPDTERKPLYLYIYLYPGEKRQLKTKTKSWQPDVWINTWVPE